MWGTLVHWHMPGVLEKDSDWGLATLRQRLLLRFRLLLERLEQTHSSPPSQRPRDGRSGPSPPAGPTSPIWLPTRPIAEALPHASLDSLTAALDASNQPDGRFGWG